jgi:hypothetical protein
VRALLHEDFVEIGRSGRRWTRDEIIASLGEEGDRSAPDVDEGAFVSLSSELVLVTYRVRGGRGESRHASIWDVGTEPPQMRFHQGSVVPGGESSGSRSLTGQDLCG